MTTSRQTATWSPFTKMFTANSAAPSSVDLCTDSDSDRHHRISRATLPAAALTVDERAVVEIGGAVASRQGLNIPGEAATLPAVPEEDLEHLRTGDLVSRHGGAPAMATLEDRRRVTSE